MGGEGRKPDTIQKTYRDEDDRDTENDTKTTDKTVQIPSQEL